MYVGTIKSIENLGASVIRLILEDDKGQPDVVPAEGRLTVAALEDAFGSVEGAIGSKIEYEVTEFGSLAGFNPL